MIETTAGRVGSHLMHSASSLAPHRPAPRPSRAGRALGQTLGRARGGALLGLALALAATPSPALTKPVPAPPGDGLGIADRGIFSDLDGRVRLSVDAADAAVELVADPTHGVLVLYADGWPVKVYPLTDAAPGADGLALRPRDRAELAPLRARAHLRTLPPKAAPPPGDRDRDGIPDPLDVLIGAKKTALNRAQYGAGYQKLDYPMGDVPRDQGVCTDVIVRAVRNAGLDIQVEIQRDIRRAPAAYPMVSRPNRHIDHRRVRTLLPYFQRRWDRRSVTLNDPDDPLRPGDVLFFDTLPDRSGPDHVGIASDRVTADGLPLVINNWSDGSVTAEMDLLAWVPVTHRFRIPPARRSRR